MEEGEEPSRELFLEVYAGVEGEERISGGGMFRLDCMTLERVRSLKDLAGGRIHFMGGASVAMDDDTLGSVPPEAYETGMWYLGYEDYDTWAYDEIKVDFEDLGENRFKIKVECIFSTHSDKIEARAEFMAKGLEKVWPE